MSRPRRRAWIEARHALAGGAEIAPVASAPLPAGVRPDAWDTCECDYVPPQVDGKTVPHRLDPAWQWTEDRPISGNVIETALRPQVELLLWGDEEKGIPALYPLGGFHSGDPRFDSPGFPDLILWSPRNGRPIARELKRMGHWPEIVQAAHLTSMRLSGWDVAVWQPCCLLSGHISAQLSAWSGVPLHRHDRFARLGPAQPLAGLAAAVAAHKAGARGQLPRKRAHPAAAAPVNSESLLTTHDGPEAAGMLPAGDAVGYSLALAGTIDETQATAIGRLRSWATSRGVCRTGLVWPWRLVVADGCFFLEIRAESGKSGRRWVRIERQPGETVDVVALVESLGPRTVAESSVRKCMTALSPATAIPAPTAAQKLSTP